LTFRRARHLPGHFAGRFCRLLQQPDPEVDPDPEVLRQPEEGQTPSAQNR